MAHLTGFSVITTNVSHVFGTEFTDVGLSPATTYHYRVRAVNDTDFSEFSNEVRVTTLSTRPPTKKGIHPPTELAATAVFQLHHSPELAGQQHQ